MIVDDEPVFAGELRQYVNKICLDNRVTAEIQITDDSEFLLMNGKDFDFVLLDIEMPKYSGIDLASKINEQKGGSGKPYIIFVTNRDGLVFDALKQQPFSFVRKSHLDDLKPCFDPRQENRSTAQRLSADTYRLFGQYPLHRSNPDRRDQPFGRHDHSVKPQIQRSGQKTVF